MNNVALRFTLLSLALSVASCVPAAFAQESGAAGVANASAAQHGAPDPQKQTARLAKRLQLTDDQAAKVTSILQSRLQQLAAARSDSSLAAQDRHAKVRAIRQDADSQINALLNPDQQKRYAEMEQNAKNRWQRKHGAANASSHYDGSSNGGGR